MEEILIKEHYCSKCNNEIKINQKFCTNCGYPEFGSISDKATFNSNEVQNYYKLKEAPKKIKSARTSLFVISGISFLYGLIMFFSNDDSASLITSAILSIIYLVLGYWSQQKPLIALVLGLLVYLTIMVLNGIIEPSTIYKGIIIKVLIIAYLGKGINSALHLRKSNLD